MGEPDLKDSKKRALVVEDNEDLRLLMKHRLKKAGLKVSTAKSGRSAIEKMGSHPADIVFLDYRLPDMSGAEVAMQIRNGTPSQPKIVALTGLYPSEVRNTPGSETIDRIVQKPVSRELLGDILQEFGCHDNSHSE